MITAPKNKKILVLTSTFPRWAGDTNATFILELSTRLSRHFSLIVLAPHSSGSKTKETISRIKVFRFHYFFAAFEKLTGGILPLLWKNPLYYFVVPPFLISQFISTLKLVRQFHPDYIHAHWIIPQGLVAYFNFKINHTPYIITSHGSDLHSLKFNFLKKIILKNAQKITVVSSGLASEIAKIDPTLLSKTEIIPMGVDTKLFNVQQKSPAIRKKYQITGPFLLYVGRLSPEKGVRYLLEALPRVINVFPNSKLLIIGTGTLEAELKKQAALLKINDNVIFNGVIEHNSLPPFFATADLFISPSLSEGYGLTLAESIASGCPTLTLNPKLVVDLPQLIVSTPDHLSADIIKSLQIRPTPTVPFINSWDFVLQKYLTFLNI